MLSRCVKPILYLKGEYIVKKYDMGQEVSIPNKSAAHIQSTSWPAICIQVHYVYHSFVVMELSGIVTTDVFHPTWSGGRD